MSNASFTLGRLAELLGFPAPQESAAEITITGVASLEDAAAGDLSLISSAKYLKQFAATGASAVLVDRKLKIRPPATGPSVLEVDDAEAAIIRVLELFAPKESRPPTGIDPAARVDASAVIGEGVAVGCFTSIGARSRIGAGTIIDNGVFIGDDVTIGRDCRIYPQVTIRQRLTIGDRVIINANSAIGTDGFGYRWDGKKHAKVPQIGTVVIEDDVELGSCVCIDRAKFGVTRIGRGSKIDNLVQIAHNCVIGPNCIIAGQAGLAGTVRLGAGVLLGGQSAIRDHVTIGDGAMVAACAGVAEDVPPKAVVSGVPALPHRQSLREQAAFRRLPELLQQLRSLQEKSGLDKKE